jgi:DNA-binding NarL/FixJ family response regulator
MINIIIADDQTILRESLKQSIELDTDLKVIASAHNGKEALNLCHKFVPDVILMDVQMPECDGIEGTRLIKDKFNHVKILMLTSYQDEEYISQALNFGADGYLLKDVKPDMLKLAIKNVHLGIPVIHKDALAVLTKNMNTSNTSKSESDLGNNRIRFTSREIEIMFLVAKGKTNRDIAKEVCLSKGRVANIITNIFEKTGLTDRTELAVFAVKNGIL